MKNKEWLQSMEPSELSAWFEAEHVDDMRGKTSVGVAYDSRERLESDVCEAAELFELRSDCGGDFVGIVTALLDRQAAILWADIGRLKSENTALARELGECMAERDELRERLSQAIDHAYAAVSLLDLDGYQKDEGLA